MVKQIDKNEARLRRHRRVRNKISGTMQIRRFLGGVVVFIYFPFAYGSVS